MQTFQNTIKCLFVVLGFNMNISLMLICAYYGLPYIVMSESLHAILKGTVL